MEYISSDTNIWIDFYIIDRIELPFRLPYTFVMYQDAIAVELLPQTNFRYELLDYGLMSVDLTIEEFELAAEFGPRYPRLSIYDRIALSIAKTRHITLLTGDGALRRAAKSEMVRVFGTIGILDQLLDGNYINEQEYEYCLLEFQKHNGCKIRLPENEITTRLQKLEAKQGVL